MDKFGFIVHPMSIKNVHRFFPLSVIFPQVVIEKALACLPPFKIGHVKNIRSKTGKEIEGYFIVCPFLSKQILELDEAFVLRRIILAGRIAKNLKVNMLGLGALAGTIGEAGKIVSEQLALPVTNGTTYAACAIIETVLKAAELRRLKLDQAKVAIIGATNSIGKICAMVLAKQAMRLSLVAKNQDRLSEFVTRLKSENSIAIDNAGTDVGKAITDAAIIIFTTTAVEVSTKIKKGIETLKKGAIICDIPVPRNITPEIAKARPDLLVIDGAAIEPSCEIKLKIDMGLLPNQIYACMAETMILTMEGKFENFSCGWEPSLKKVEEICALAHKHGFRPAFTSFGEKIL